MLQAWFCRHRPSRRQGPVLPLRRQQPRQHAGAAGLSDPRRALPHARRTILGLDAWAIGSLVVLTLGCAVLLWRSRGDGAGRCRFVPQVRASPSPARVPSVVPTLATAAALAGVVVRPLEPALGRDHLHLHRHRRRAAAVGDSAGALPADVRARLRSVAPRPGRAVLRAAPQQGG